MEHSENQKKTWHLDFGCQALENTPHTSPLLFTGSGLPYL
jgi:hypothetical protein